MSSVSLKLAEDNVLRLKDKTMFSVIDGYQSVSYESQIASSQTAQNMNFNAQPTPQNITGRDVLISTTMSWTLQISNVPFNENCFSYGSNVSINSFPLNMAINTSQLRLNGLTTSVDQSNLINQIMALQSNETLSKYNSLCPTVRDSIFGQYENAVGSTASPLNALNDSVSSNPLGQTRGTYPIYNLVIVHRDGAGAVIAGGSTVSGNINETWTITFSYDTVEPIFCLSPLLSSGLNEDETQGLFNIKQLGIQLQFNDFSRTLCYAGKTNAGVSANFGTSWLTNVSVVFSNSKMLYKSYGLSESQLLRLPGKQVLPYYDYNKNIFDVQTNALAAGATFTLKSNTVTYDYHPKYFLISPIIPTQDQDWTTAGGGFLSITGATLKYANQNALLSGLTPAQLYELSRKNGSQQSFQEFQGTINISTQATVAPNIGNAMPNAIPTAGSVLVISCFDLQLPETQSQGTPGQFQFTITLSGKNNFSYALNGIQFLVTAIFEGQFIVDENGTCLTTLNMIENDAEVLKMKLGEDKRQPRIEYEEFVGGVHGHKKHSKMGGNESGGVKMSSKKMSALEKLLKN